MQFSFPWSFWVLIAVVIAFPVITRIVEELLQQRRFARAGLTDVRRMHWRDFEKYLEHLFRSLGYQTELTPPSGDKGVDLILTDGNGRRIAVQAKQWKSKKVRSPDIQKTVGGAKYHHCEHVIVVTTSSYTDDAREFARGTGAALWGLKELGDAMERARAAGHGIPKGTADAAPHPSRITGSALPKPVAAKPLGMPVKPTTPTGPACAKCGGPMVGRTAAGRKVWVCSRFPACNGSKMMD